VPVVTIIHTFVTPILQIRVGSVPEVSIAIILFDTTPPAIPSRPVAFDEFAAAYEARFGIPPGVYADTVYDATKLMALAIEQAGRMRPR